jgi:hypothetical protein
LKRIGTRVAAGLLLLVALPAAGQSANAAVAVDAPDEPAEAVSASGAESAADLAGSLEAELGPLLARSGLPVAPDRRQLVDLAARSNRVARSAEQPTTQLRAREVEMRIYNALAQQAILAQRPSEASLRVAQLRSAARQTQELGDEQAGPIAAFWLLQADLTDLSRNEPAIARRQIAAIDRLGRFLEQVPADHALALEAQVALLRLATQAGDVAQVRQLLPTLSDRLPAADPRRAHLTPARLMLVQVGRPAPAVPEVELADRVVLLAFHRQPALDPAVSEARQLWQDRGFEVLTVTLDRTAAETDWPVPRVWDPPLFAAYGVTATPRYVLVADGQVVSVADSPAIIHQVAPHLPPDP